MKKSHLILLLLSIFGYSFSQKIHSPDQILKIMADSKIGYEVKMLDKPIVCPDYSGKLNRVDNYRIVTDSGLSTFSYKVNEKAEMKLQKAEMYFQAKDADNALIFYKQALEADSSLFFVMTYIGQMYENKGDHQSAISWFKKAISKNYIDYMAHWFLADNYKSMNDLKSAVDEITIARILNRNNRNIKKSFDNIFQKAHRDTTDWYFNPQIQIQKLSDTTVSVAMNEKWTGYGMSKALWKCEPGYSESMGVPAGQYSTFEDRECLIALIVAQINAKTKIIDDAQLRILRDAGDNKHLEEYILYEIVLPQKPFVAYQLPEKTILEIRDYILHDRNK